MKNNLQLVAGILDLQARKSREANVKRILQENVGRILSIAAIHDILTHNTNDINFVSSKALLGRLCRNLHALVPPDKQIRLAVQGDEIFMSADTASSAALVITELVTNAVRHAFPGRGEGQVTICVCAGRLYHTVSVPDDGIGVDLENAGRGRLGLGIVEAAVKEKLRGRFRIETNGGGTKAAFDFKRE